MKHLGLIFSFVLVLVSTACTAGIDDGTPSPPSSSSTSDPPDDDVDAGAPNPSTPSTPGSGSDGGAPGSDGGLPPGEPFCTITRDNRNMYCTRPPGSMTMNCECRTDGVIDKTCSQEAICAVGPSIPNCCGLF